MTSDRSFSSDLLTSHPFEGVDVYKALFCSKWKFVLVKSGLSDVKVTESRGVHAESYVSYNNCRRSRCTFIFYKFISLTY